MTLRLAPLLVLGLLACKRGPAPSDGAVAPDGCALLFGAPNDQTGLGPDQCRPWCACGGGTFRPPEYGPGFIRSLLEGWRLEKPYSPLASDPYQQPAPAEDPRGTVCGVLPTGASTAPPRAYTLVSYPSLEAATVAGARPTHFGRCGVCSTLANLAVYLRENDLTAPVRACAFAAGDGGDPTLECLQRLGFDLPCAQIWSYNTAHTRAHCLQPCLATFTDPYHQPDGSLNACLRCDEEQSGPVFKAVAGRTRRNSGLPNAICRPCSEVQPLIHDY